MNLAKQRKVQVAYSEAGTFLPMEGVEDPSEAPEDRWPRGAERRLKAAGPG